MFNLVKNVKRILRSQGQKKFNWQQNETKNTDVAPKHFLW